MAEKDVQAEQPPVTQGGQLGMKRYHRGSHRSQERLRELRFDPIGKLVDNYEKLERELEFWESLQDGTRVILKANGRELNYNPEAHMAVFDKLLKVGTELLRYGYGRVPETSVIEDRRPAGLLVTLHEEGQVYQVGEMEEAHQLPDGSYSVDEEELGPETPTLTVPEE